MILLAIDPGPTQSAWLQWTGERVLSRGFHPNDEIFERCLTQTADLLVIEKVESFGMAVGAEVFETVFWSGRFAQHWHSHGGRPVERIGRHAAKMHLCHNQRAKDSNIRQALIDRFGMPGTKRSQGRLYGIAGHLWAALAVAVVAVDTLEARTLECVREA